MYVSVIVLCYSEVYWSHIMQHYETSTEEAIFSLVQCVIFLESSTFTSGVMVDVVVVIVNAAAVVIAVAAAIVVISCAMLLQVC